ncbi:hypothetical protein B0H13DRAFT_2033274 [Mycena leptocephala]|nr:hypothetical protein B0H13DRAFT_2033274 [Mycena leptocephala]
MWEGGDALKWVWITQARGTCALMTLALWLCARVGLVVVVHWRWYSECTRGSLHHWLAPRDADGLTQDMGGRGLGSLA